MNASSQESDTDIAPRFAGVDTERPIVLLSIDSSGVVVGANPAWSSLLGHPDPSITKMNFCDVVASTDTGRVEGMLDRVAEGETVVDPNLTIDTACGRKLSFEAVFSPMGGSDEGIAATVVLTGQQQISSTHRALNDDYLFGLAEAAPTGMMLSSVDQEIVAFNTKFVDLWGIDPAIIRAGNARAEAMKIVANPDDFLESIQRAYATTEEIASGAFELADGRVLDWYSAPAWDQRGRRVGRAWYYFDATMRIEAEFDLRRSEQRYRQLVANFPDGAVVVVDGDQTVQLADGMGIASVGLSKDRIEGRRLDDIVPHRIAAQLMPVFDRALTGNRARAEIRFYDRHYALSAVPVAFGSDPTAAHAMAIVQDITKKTLLEDQLRGAETRLQSLLEQIPVITYVQQVRSDGNHTIYVSPQVEQMFGYTPDELLDGSIDWTETVHPEDRDRVVSGTDTANITGTQFLMEYRSLTKDGRVRWVRDEAGVVLDENGVARFWQGVISDITEERQLEQALRASEARFRSAFDEAPTGIALIGLDGRTFRVNKAFCSLVGYDEAELLQPKMIGSMTHVDDRERDVQKFKRLIQGQIDSYTTVKRLLTRDNQIVRTRMNASFVEGDDGKPVYVIAQFEDITEQFRLQRELEQSEAIFRSAFDHAAIGMARVSPDGQWLDVNESLCRILGYRRDELLALNFQQITHPDDLEEDRDLVEQMLDGSISTYNIEKRYIRRDGSIVWGELNVSLVRDVQDEPLFFLSQIQDVTKKKELEGHLALLAHYDRLTGTLNRHGLSDAIEESADSEDDIVAVLMLDIDDFKSVNDTYGHDVGDQVLRETAARIGSCLRGGDLVARIGGDEFLVIIKSPTSRDIAETIAARIRSAVSQPMRLVPGNRLVQVELSVGVEVGPREIFESVLLPAADRAMYAEKRARKAA